MKKLLSGILAVAIASAAMQMAAYAERYTPVSSEFSLSFDSQTAGEQPEGLTAVQGSVLVADLDGEMCLKVATTATASSKSNVYILNPTSSSTAQTVTTDGAIVASARYYFPRALSSNRLLRIDLYSDSSSQRTCQAFNFYNDKIYAGGTQTAELCTYPIGEWFTLKYTVIPAQAGTTDSYGRLEIISKGVTEVLYDLPLDQIGANALFPNNAVSIWQHNLIVQNTQTDDTAENEVCYYIDDMKLESVKQTSMIDADFDDEYYHAGRSPSRVSFKNDSTGLNISVADMGGEHGNALKCTAVRGAFRNTNNMSAAVCKELGNAWIFEYDLYCQQALPAGKSIFPMFYTGEETTQPSAFAFAPYCIYGDKIYPQIGGKGTALAQIPIGEWFKMKLIYAFGDDWGSDTVVLQMIDKDGNVNELYRKTRTALAGYITYNGTQFPVKGVGRMVMTVDDNTAGDTYYFDNFKMYSFDVPSAENLTVKGLMKEGSRLTADYSFKSTDGGSDESEIVWYRGSNVADGANSARDEIARGSREYTLTAEDCGRYIVCEVMPKSSKGTQAYTAVSVQVTVPGITYDFENAAQISTSITAGAVSAEVGTAEIGGRNAAYIAPNAGVTGARGSSFQNKYPFGGIGEGTIIYSTDLYIPHTMADGSNMLMQYFTAPTSVAGRYANAYWIKNNKLCASDGNTVLCDLPQNEWFSIKSVISVSGNKHLMVTLLETENAEASVVDRREITLSGMDTDGFMYARLSYSVAEGDDGVVYIDNMSLKNEMASGIYNVSAAQNGSNVEFSAKLVDYSYSGGVMILKDNDTTDFTVKIKELNSMQAEKEVSEVMEDAVLGSGFRVFVWDGTENIRPVLSYR